MGWQHTNALLLKTGETGGLSTFTGKIKTFDAFFSKKPMTLHVTVEVQYCNLEKKSIAIFRFSPQILEHEIWHKLNAVTLLNPTCNP
jgi:hypothetical protein